MMSHFSYITFSCDNRYRLQVICKAFINVMARKCHFVGTSMLCNRIFEENVSSQSHVTTL